MLTRHLTPEQMLRWVQVKDDSWDSFYTFLEELSETVRRILGYQETLKAIGMHTSEVKSNNDKKLCPTCGKKLGGVCNREGNIIASTGFHQNNPKYIGNDQYAGRGNSTNDKKNKYKTCIICKGPSHFYKDLKTGEDRITRRLIDC